MTHQEIIDYVMHTPHNTNPAILKQKLNELQPDWSQNDPTKPDYVKNRTHYSEIGDVIVLDSTLEPMGEQYIAEVDVNIKPFDGEPITVMFNGKTYNVTLTYRAEWDDYVAKLTEGAQVMVYGGGNEWCWCVLAQEAGSVTISIVGEVVHKLDAKYLPEPFTVEEKVTLVVEGVTNDSGDFVGVNTPLVEGKEYTFFIDGVKYTGECFDDDTCLTVHLRDEDGVGVVTVYDEQISLYHEHRLEYHKIERMEQVYHTIHDLMIIADIQHGEDESIENIQLVAGDFATAKAKIFKGHPVTALTCLTAYNEWDDTHSRINVVGSVCHYKVGESDEWLFVCNNNGVYFEVLPDNTVVVS